MACRETRCTGAEPGCAPRRFQPDGAAEGRRERGGVGVRVARRGHGRHGRLVLGAEDGAVAAHRDPGAVAAQSGGLDLAASTDRPASDFTG